MAHEWTEKVLERMQRVLPGWKSRVGVLCKGGGVSCSIVMLLSRFQL